MSAHFESIKAFLKLPISKKATASQIPFPVRILPSMESSRGQNGILQLLAAEQEPQQIVNAARNAKMARLKQAKEEAKKELGAFRARMEAEFHRKLAESSGDSGTNVKRLEKETEVKIHHQKNQAGRISHDVVQMLLKYDGEELRSPRSLVNYKW